MITRRDLLIGTAGLAGIAAAPACNRDAQWKKDFGGRRVRLGVVGGNFGSRFQFHLHPNCDVVAVSDLYAERRAKLQRVYGCDTGYDSLAEMLKQHDELDAVALFTPATDHVAHVKQCLARELHVLSAIPACHSIESAQDLAEHVQASGLTYMSAETTWYRPETIWMREQHAAGALGELFYSEVDYYHDKKDLDRLVADRSSRFYTPDGKDKSWRWGFPPMLYPTHALAFVTAVTGERVTAVSALGWGTDHPFLTDNAYGNPFWNETALMQTDEGHAVRCNIFWLVASGPAERASWHGANGSVHMAAQPLHNGKTINRYPLETERLSVPDYVMSDRLPKAMRVRTHHSDSHGFLSAEFIEAILEARAPAIGLRESLAINVPGLVAHASALAGGKQLPVPDLVG